ncbi:unannotated protein [freshwater metagenome]|uniref:Unannotated protein n=1 Tax=freshwater metagenome TaxID=449393 RepID=A0A6J6T1Z9_9ZZZZ|nr:4'-phosphopantetheinyl transferase superfamily protein [Actinomycetota bacterium]MTA63902.1 4'-phosphopantetheinyl transferase superfamily protein [Actinomycetota bacterium]
MGVSGLGLEFIEVSSFTSQLNDPNSGVVLGAFTAAEMAQAGELQPTKGRRLAARWAAKLAFLQAVSASNSAATTPLAAADLAEIEVVNDSFGRPSLCITGEVAQIAEECLGSDWAAHVSLTHEGNQAAAVVVIELTSTLGLE